ncbi:MAG: cupredoxin domain-containing protein [Proteobacteria bacterium]|nr:cupredoxin domain-containing protein [Pseudomonadota bacterium]
MNRRAWLAAAAAAVAAGCGGALVADRPSVRVVQIHTKKFVFVPNHIALKKGEPVILEFVADDITMGFRAPDLGLRTEVHPGMVTRLPFTPQKAGKFDFYCDIFCGDGHEEMDGEIVVT